MRREVLDPRSKLVATLAAMVLLMTVSEWTWLVVALTVLSLAILALRLRLPWLAFLKGLGFAVLSFFLIAWISFDLDTALEAGLRLLAVGSLFFLFFQTTSPEDLSNALVRVGFPYALAFVLTVSMQFIPVLTRRTSTIRDAQRARGIPLEGIRTLRHLPALLGPLLIQAFKLADEMAEAMEARGFGAPGRRFRHEPRFRGLDWLTVGLSIALVAAAVWVRRG